MDNDTTSAMNEWAKNNLRIIADQSSYDGGYIGISLEIREGDNWVQISRDSFFVPENSEYDL